MDRIVAAAEADHGYYRPMTDAARPEPAATIPDGHCQLGACRNEYSQFPPAGVRGRRKFDARRRHRRPAGFHRTAGPELKLTMPLTQIAGGLSCDAPERAAAKAVIVEEVERRKRQPIQAG
jgi:hypothetical protein